MQEWKIEVDGKRCHELLRARARAERFFPRINPLTSHYQHYII